MAQHFVSIQYSNIGKQCQERQNTFLGQRLRYLATDLVLFFSKGVRQNLAYSVLENGSKRKKMKKNDNRNCD